MDVLIEKLKSLTMAELIRLQEKGATPEELAVVCKCVEFLSMHEQVVSLTTSRNEAMAIQESLTATTKVNGELTGFTIAFLISVALNGFFAIGVIQNWR